MATLSHFLQYVGVGTRRYSYRMLSSSSARESGKTQPAVYEFRTYAVHPGKMGESMQMLEELLPMRMKRSKMIGCWYTELGGLNELHFMWEYESLSHRTSIRKDLANDQEWLENLARFLPLLASQTNMLLKPFPWFEPNLTPLKGYSIYDLVTHGVKPGMVPQFEHILQERQPLSLELEYPKPLGMWYSEYGPGPTVLSISPHKSFEEREKHRAAMMDDVEWKEMYKAVMKLTNSFTVKALIPISRSPLQ